MSAIELFGWLVEITAVVSLLLAAVLLLRLPLANVVGARWAYAIWAIPLARVLFSLLPEGLQSGIARVTMLPTLEGAPSLANLETSSGLAVVAVGIWIAGTVVVAGRFAVQHGVGRRRLLMGTASLSQSEQKQIDLYCERMQVFPTIRCLQTERVRSPVLLGLWRPVLLLPPRFLQDSPEPELVIRHELIHFKRRDLWHLTLLNVMRCLFWFNPLVHFAVKYFRSDQELACDQAVVASESRSRRYNYGLAMVDVAESSLPAGVAFVSSEPALKRRARMLSRHNNGLLRNTGGLSAVLALLLLGTTFGADATKNLDWNTPLTFPGPVPGHCD